MNSHVFQKLGVAYKANLKHIVQLFIFSVVFFGILNSTDSAPVLPNSFVFDHSRNNSDIMVPPEKVNPSSLLFLHANNNMWLEILEDGTVKTNTCPTVYGALESGTHQPTGFNNGKLNEAKEVADQAGVYLKGIKANRYLCVNSSGVVYATPDFHPVDCAFIQRPQFENYGGKYHYFKHLHHTNTYKKRISVIKSGAKNVRKRTHKTVRFQLGFNTNGTVFVVQRHTQRRKEFKPMLSINMKRTTEMPTNYTCPHQIKLKTVKKRYKFCRKVWKNYFRSSVKKIRRFRKYDCWSKLREYRKLRTIQKNKGDTG